MTYNYQLSEEAESDVFEAYLWYEKQREGLGDAFLESLDAAGQVIANNPMQYQVRYKEKVRAFFSKPFSISDFICYQ